MPPDRGPADRERLVEEMLAEMRQPTTNARERMSAALTVAEAALARREGEIRADERNKTLDEADAAMRQLMAERQAQIDQRIAALAARAADLQAAIRAREAGEEGGE